MKLIDADELKEQLKQRYEAAVKWRSETVYYERADGEVAAYLEAIMTVNNAPTVDPKDFIRHGKWIESHGVFDYITCSECKKTWRVEDNDTETFKYCPFKYCPECGAMMDLPLLLEETDWDEERTNES